MRELPESWIRPEWLVSLGQIELLARLGSTKILTVRVRPRRTPRHTSASRDPSHLSATKQPIRQRLAQPARRSGATHLSGTDPPLRSSLDPLPPAMGPKSLAWPLAACHSPVDVQLNPRTLFQLVFSRSTRRAILQVPCRLVPRTGSSPGAARDLIGAVSNMRRACIE